jgi:site-specific recombinase XerD
MRIYFCGPNSPKPRLPFLVDADMRPVSEVNAWLRSLTRDGATRSPHTWRAQGYNALDFLKFLESERIAFKKATDDILFRYRDTQDLNISRHTKSHLSRRTINRRIISAGQLYEFLAKTGVIEANPFQYKKVTIKRPADTELLAHLGSHQVVEVPAATFERISRPDLKWRPHAEVMEWLNSIEDRQQKLFSKILYRSGMRREEGVNLSVLQIPERDSVDQARNEVCFNIKGKGGKIRLIYISMRDFNELHDYILYDRSKYMKASSRPHDRLWVDEYGSPWKPAYVNYFFSKVSKTCRIHITPHMLRHSFAVRALQVWKKLGLSQPEKLLQARLGHSNVSTTQIYMHLTDELKAQEALGNASLIEQLMERELS